MHPQVKPYRPSMHQLQAQGRRFPPNHLHESWLDYLYWDVELEGTPNHGVPSDEGDRP